MLLLLPKKLSCLISVEVRQLLCWLVHKKADIKIKHCKFVQFAGLPEGLPLQLNPCKETHNAATMATPLYT